MKLFEKESLMKKREKEGDVVKALTTLSTFCNEPMLFFNSNGTLLGSNDTFKSLPNDFKSLLLTKMGNIKEVFLKRLKSGLKTFLLKSGSEIKIFHLTPLCKGCEEKFLVLGVLYEREYEAFSDENLGREEIFRMITHELKSSLSGLLLSLEFLSLQIEKISLVKAKEKIKMALKQVISLNNLVENFLDVEKLKNGVVEPCIEKFPSSYFLEDIKDLIEPISASKNLKFTLITKNLPKYFVTDEAMLERILINLLTNSVKFTDNGYVKLSCYGQKNGVKFVVEDSGIGIEKEELKNIFLPFKRIKNERKIAGFGLGLYLVKEFLDIMKGTIEVESEINSGSKFSVFIPFK